MDPKILLTASIASVIGAVALWLLLRPGRMSIKAIAAVVGLGVFGTLISNVSLAILGDGEQVSPNVLFMVFSTIAIIAAVCMITSARPVYSALYFVMVVLSSAALFLLLSAEFMAFALIIVYAGAILITYMFVLMLAQQASDSEHGEDRAEYDVNPREPAAAAVIAFIMLALLSTMIYQGVGDLDGPMADSQIAAESWRKLDMMPIKRDQVLEKVAAGATLQLDEDGNSVRFHADDQAFYLVLPEGANQTIEVDLPDELMPSNVELVGLDLIAKFPVSLELAGIILLMAMFGAVILARKQIELGEDELRDAAGMSRATFDGSESGGGEA